MQQAKRVRWNPAEACGPERQSAFPRKRLVKPCTKPLHPGIGRRGAEIRVAAGRGQATAPGAVASRREGQAETGVRRGHSFGTDVASPLQVGQLRRARFTADRTARIEAVTVFVSTPTPQKTPPPISHST